MADEGLTQEELNVEFDDAYSEPYSEEEETYSEAIPKLPNESVKKNDALDDGIRASEKGEDPRIAFEKTALDPNYDDKDREVRIEESLDNIFKLQEERLAAQVSSGVPIDAEKEAKRFQGISDAANDALAESKLYIMSHPNSANYTEKEVEDAAWLHYVRGKTAEVWGEMDKVDVALDFAGYVVAPMENLRMSDLAELIGADFKADDLVDTTQFISSLTHKIMSEAPELRVKLIDHIIDSWSEIKGDNRLALVDLLGKLSGDFNEDMSHIENALERGDQVSYILAFPKILRGAMRGFNALRMARKMKALEATADMVKAGSRGELTEVGITPLEAASTLDPMADTPNLLKGSGASPEVTEGVSRIEAQIAIFTDEIDKFNNPGLGLTKDEMKSAMNRAEKAYDEGYEGIAEVRAVERDDLGFDLTYDVVDSKGKLIRRESTPISFTRDDIAKKGAFKSGHREAGKSVTSPLYRFKEAGKELVRLPEWATFQGAKIRSLYDGAIRQSLKGLNKKSVKKVEALLEEGDQFTDDKMQLVGKVFDRADAKKRGLSDEEFEAYQGMRAVVDHMYWAKDSELVNDRNARGILSLKWGEQELPVKAYDDVVAAKAGFTQSDVRSHWIATDNAEGGKRVVDKFADSSALKGDYLAKKYDEGFVLVKGDNKGLLPDGDDYVEWAFVRRENLSKATRGILNRRTGYMPKIRKDAFYFAKERVVKRVAGKDVDQYNTVRYFDNKTDADTFVESLGDSKTYKVLADKEMSPSEIEAEHLNLSGGLFKGSRKSTDIPFGLPFEGRKGERAGALESLQRYVNNISKNMPMSVYRMGLQQRWLNHAKDLRAIPASYTGDFSSAIHKIVPGSEAAEFLKDSHGQIKFLSGIPTEAEEAFATKLRSLAEIFEGHPKLGGKWMSRQLHETSQESMAGLARGLTFHLMLGMYNPAQLLIQGSGALVALSINPVHAMKAMPTVLGAGIADLAISNNPAKFAKFTKYIAKQGFLDEDAYAAWRKSGMLEGTTHSSLDYQSLWNDVPYDAPLWRRVVGNGDMFYKSGELFNSRVSFFTAYNHWKELNPGKKLLDSDIKDIVFRAEEYRLNMSKVNSSKFQKGLISVPTQFQKVNTSFYEKMIGDTLTWPERRRLIGGQALVFGGAGVPILGGLTPILLDTIGLNAEEAPPELLKAIQAGTLGWLLTDHLDINSLVTGRMTLGTDFVERMFDAISDGVIPWDVIRGPFGNIWDRADNIFDQWHTALNTVIEGGESLSAADMAAVGKILVRSSTAIASSTASVRKSYDMYHSDIYRNKDGKGIFEWEDKNLQTVAFQAIGFAPSEPQDWYEFNAREMALGKEDKDDDAKRLAWLLSEVAREEDPVQQRFFAMATNALRTKYKGWEWEEVYDKLIRQMSDPTETWGSKMIKAAQEYEREVVEGLAAIHKHSKLRTNPRLAKAFQEGEE